ncbi:predicted protein [Aspergillus nidulans FGSC A4]|uniref:Uncharacterized protein n=1 Tax=Emericella nidulans (strain FGSC A4 / ATCC 38163 / CBS 112.46 / NRRL 194 / M139) TaxID=227321 RepID=Q5B7N8_EMENI|nr:hypothetical protein [Aspergillus nidulans FGSC A4]EAA62898.1 predicted protein [Aspergillus nidulans FGSC A4]CBF82701.1 TPA: conserved hypothetical protein [Aspergillus nidulans FGSC A4]|eukprot:XP_661046.1 predicted protein [Aspergillus nidulans FGSC A4]
MRFRLGRCVSAAFPLIRHRSFHHVPRLADVPTIYENSLQKTLEEHRALNRSRLIRKVYVQSDSDQSDGPYYSAEKPVDSDLSQSPKSQGQPWRTEEQPPTVLHGYGPVTKRRTTKDKPRPKGLMQTLSPPVDWKATADKPRQYPWLDGLNPPTPFSDGLAQLSAEVEALEKYLTPSAQEREVADRIASDVTDLLSSDKLDQSIHIARTGFTMSHSALDLMVSFVDQDKSTGSNREPYEGYVNKKRRQKELLELARRALRQSSTYELLLNKRQRKLMVLHKPTGLLLRIICAPDKPATLEYLRDFHAEYPTLSSLYMVIRLILEVRGLFASTQNSMDNTELQLLIAAFLKMNHGRFRRDALRGESLLAFLYTFGMQVDLTTTGVAVDPPGFFTAESVASACTMYDPGDIPAFLRGQSSLIKTKTNAMKWGNEHVGLKLLIQDPENYMRHAPGTCSRTIELQPVFLEAYLRLKFALDSWVPRHVRPFNSILNSALRANFHDFEGRRAAILGSSGKI